MAGAHSVQSPVCGAWLGHYGHLGRHCGGLAHSHCVLSAAVPEREVAEEKGDMKNGKKEALERLPFC